MKKLALVAAASFAPVVFGAPAPASLERQFTDTVRPAVGKYCTTCHSGKSPAAQFDLKAYDTMSSAVKDYPRWEQVLGRVSANEMPPKGAPQPPAEVRKSVIDWIQAVRKEEIAKNAGDPGAVLARRLSNSEYNYTIRDLTGVDLRPTKEFPVDPANQAGFDNSGESLTMSAGLMSRYLDAARNVANHMVLNPDNIAFSPHTMLAETDRDRYAIERIVNFYKRQPTGYADYFEAAWRYKNRAALGQPRATLASIAADMKLSAKYLPMVWHYLEDTKEEVGPPAKLQAMWRALPAGKQTGVRDACVQMASYVSTVRRHTEKLFSTPNVAGMNANFQPFVMWRNREIVAHRRDFDPAALRVAGEPEPKLTETDVTKGPTFGKDEQVTVKKAIADYIKERTEDPELMVPAGQRARYEAAFARFSSVFPTRFYLAERGRFYPIDTYDLGRYLGAGFHNVTGYFRDDAVLSELILDENGKKELDRLWQEFDYIADYNVRTWNQFLLNGGGGRGMSVVKPNVNEANTEAAIFKMRDQYLKPVPPDQTAVIQAIRTHFDSLNAAVRWVEKARAEAEPKHLDALLKFAARAYRRNLTPEEKNEILAYYRELRKDGKMSHEDAIRGSVVSLLVSPEFLYRIDLIDAGPAPRAATSSSHRQEGN